MTVSINFHCPFPDITPGNHVTATVADQTDGRVAGRPYVSVAVRSDGNLINIFLASYHDARTLAEAFVDAAALLMPPCNATMWDENEYGRYPIHDEPCTLHDSTGARFLVDMDEAF